MYRQNVRQSNFELLRIISMACIIMSHYFFHNVSKYVSPPLQAYIFGIFASTANNIFFLLTGFFLQRNNFTFHKFAKFVIQVLIINYLILIVDIMVYGLRNPVDILKSLFPISSSRNWFATAYFGVMLLIPLIKKGTLFLRKHISIYNYFLLVLLTLFGLIGFITPTNYYYSGLGFGIYIVFVGDYISFNKEKITKYNLWLTGLISLALMIGAILMLSIASSRFGFLTEYIDHFQKNGSPLVLIFASSILLMFSKVTFKSRLINVFASSVFTTYLIHDNEAFKEHVWVDILKGYLHLDHVYLYMIFCVLVILLTGFIFDFIYIRTFEKLIMKLLGKPLNRANSLFLGCFSDVTTSSKC